MPSLLLHRHFRSLLLLLCLLCGLAAGKFAATLLGVRATPAPAAPKLLPREQVARKEQRSLQDYELIVRNNLFDRDQRDHGFSPLLSPQVAQPTTAATSTGNRQASSKWQLLGTIAGENSAVALFSDGRVSYGVKAGKQLPDGSRLLAVERNRAQIELPDGQRLWLEPQPENKPGRKTAGRKKSAPVTAASRPGMGSIEPQGENSWRIPPDVAEKARTNVGDLLKQAQAIPYLEQGKTAGFQLRMIQPNSLIAQLGLKIGDVLYEINDLPLTSPEKALQVFGQLRQATQVRISLKRQGRPLTFSYEIR